MDGTGPETAAATPMMAQYLEIKGRHPGALLFYRMGDFYEMFFEDAVAAASALDIALTKRGTHVGQPIPMCGVPVQAAESYLLTLIRKGFRVAIAEQMEDPAEAKKRGSKSVVARTVAKAARKLCRRASSSDSSVSVPGVTSRTTSRFTTDFDPRFLASAGSSNCSAMATRKPLRISVSR